MHSTPPKTTPSTQPPPPSVFQWLFRRSRAARLWIFLSVGLGFAGGLLLIVQAGLIARIVQAVFIDGRPRSALTGQFVAFALVIGGRALLAWAREASGFRAGARIREEVRLSLFDHLAALGPGFTRSEATGSLATTVVEQVEALHAFFAHYLPQLALAVLVPLSMVAVVFPISWTAGLVLTVSAPLIPLFMVLVGMGAESVSERQFQALSRMSAHFLDILQGLPTLKLFQRSRAEGRRVAEASREYRLRTMRVLRVAFLSSAVLEFFSALSIALVAVYLGTRFLGYVEFGTYGRPLTLGAGLFILALAPDFYLPLRELGTHYHARAAAAGAAADIMRILATPLPERPEAVNSALPGVPPEIVFERVCFNFGGPGERVLQEVAFTVRPGETVALAGPSGAGKSTLLDLLMGFHQPASGEIRVDGLPLAGLPLREWRRRLAWVGQQAVLFYGTLEDNIRLGRPGADAAAVREAARFAGVDEFADRLPRGYATPVGEKGNRLSRGQAQRVALARAFLADAPLLLLDEPTAGLDRENERLVSAAIERLRHNRTVLMVTHRLSHMRRADRVLVLSGGRIVEEGPYQDLTAARGTLFHLLPPPGEGARP